ncbi:universal stress protein [Cryobacterium sp. TMT1-21]|uniref:Universal stress protein n=1 Tax=Cryobacterium shii TaxID=1259235 RepID=A0AAQ2C4M4_9MICO|nr:MULTISPECIES: universal stress protein [Cryobacterium]TFC43150.1 universal stress protein [Cryobacterium shii]TFC86213.1 universal stress protein [Cryobacterium sp. TmT2-59]TFD12655.1 universal stress protein [Cryobacterium sp. TMT1-21]TFD17382.1 universal stress protein [Cryobacterium sp. TMT4-10]TFD20795.1 universal stress protein [Cryobacterium sp. TMT2-23]
MSDLQPEQPPLPPNSIVVGHDGSDYATHALSAALEIAGQLHAPVVVVRAWSIDTASRPANWEFGYVSSLEEYAEAVRDELARDVRAEVAKHPDVEVDYRAVYASPVKCLTEIAKGARMLVVGPRGRGGLAGMLLGSVSEQCVRHAKCPVLVVRPTS